MKNKIKMMNNEKGQALVEFFLFFPIIILIYSAFIRIGSAINGSINQQSITRGYYFSRVKGNSTVPTLQTLISLESSGISKSGMFAIGWRDYAMGESAIAPCYSINPLAVGLKEGDDVCENQPDTGEKKSSNIRVRSMFGICSARYELQAPDLILPEPMTSSNQHCVIEN